MIQKPSSSCPESVLVPVTYSICTLNLGHRARVKQYRHDMPKMTCHRFLKMASIKGTVPIYEGSVLIFSTFPTTINFESVYSFLKFNIHQNNDSSLVNRYATPP